MLSHSQGQDQETEARGRIGSLETPAASGTWEGNSSQAGTHWLQVEQPCFDTFTQKFHFLEKKIFFCGLYFLEDSQNL